MSLFDVAGSIKKTASTTTSFIIELPFLFSRLKEHAKRFFIFFLSFAFLQEYIVSAVKAEKETFRDDYLKYFTSHFVQDISQALGVRRSKLF